MTAGLAQRFGAMDGATVTQPVTLKRLILRGGLREVHWCPCPNRMRPSSLASGSF